MKRLRTLVIISVLCLTGCQSPSRQAAVQPGAITSFFSEKYEAEKTVAARIQEQTSTLVPLGLDQPVVPTFIRLPDFPMEARRNGVQGGVAVRFTIDTDGTVREVCTVGTSHEILANAAVDAVKLWRFNPPTKGGKPTRIRVEQVIRFQFR